MSGAWDKFMGFFSGKETVPEDSLPTLPDRKPVPGHVLRPGEMSRVIDGVLYVRKAEQPRPRTLRGII
ncbi:hypothetical protein [Mesorhizobium captivum]|uniref:hypothetical protein n=1 Tax=Mesorhizobium captivum TaxID=3072319 RepID=UPI002A246BBC|nr:hypothetical protein [Mesorhizobium sp. VK3C]MDX8447059.1 hypothetical protein [Mesorhizobium sp. VK3C]